MALCKKYFWIILLANICWASANRLNLNLPNTIEFLKENSLQSQIDSEYYDESNPDNTNDESFETVFFKENAIDKEDAVNYDTTPLEVENRAVHSTNIRKCFQVKTIVKLNHDNNHEAHPETKESFKCYERLPKNLTGKYELTECFATNCNTVEDEYNYFVRRKGQSNCWKRQLKKIENGCRCHHPRLFL